MGDWEGGFAFAQYADFRVGNADTRYRLTAGSYSGNAGDSLSYNHDRMFTTYDQNNDLLPASNCSHARQGAWWYYSCTYANLNGRYNGTSRQAVEWADWRGEEYSLRFVEMKIRP